MERVKLDPNKARTDLTSREIAKLLGGFIGGLIEMAELDEIETAVKWWAENPEAWEHFEKIKEEMKSLYSNHRIIPVDDWG